MERNLHDGAQQRLATLALSLAMLRDRDGADPAAAAALAQAAAELKQAIGELRELARGIHPAILTEEGLPAAVESLADRSLLPVRIAADFDARLPEAVEAAGYFVVSESLANVAKYARASAARVKLSRCNGSLRVEVIDDGIGGADPDRGSGLRGLEDRVSALRGSFCVEPRLGAGPACSPRYPAMSERAPVGRPGSVPAAPPAVRVVLADDSVLFREGLARVLAENGFVVAGQAGDADALRVLVGRAEPDVVVTDIRMPPTNTNDGLRRRPAPRRPEPAAPAWPG